MDKKSILKAISLILAAIAVLGFVGYFTIKDTGGFIDFVYKNQLEGLF